MLCRARAAVHMLTWRLETADSPPAASPVTGAGKAMLTDLREHIGSMLQPILDVLPHVSERQAALALEQAGSAEAVSTSLSLYLSLPYCPF